MTSFQEQFSAATRTNLESQLALLTALTGKAFESVEKVIELNMNVAKAALEESTSNARQLLAAKDPQEFIALSTSQAQPNTEKAASYGREVMAIVSGLQAEVTKAAESQIGENSRKFATMVEEVSKTAPAGSENVVAFMKTAIANANAGYEQLSKSGKQAVEAMGANLNTAAAQMSQAASKASARVAPVAVKK
nr:phasin family protein [uncultured Noviherbaspirillum sp.]